MSSHTFLCTTPEPTKPPYGACPPEGGVLTAAVSIPVFWYMLFDDSSLALGPDKEDPGRSYLHLTTPTADGVARAEGRWPAVSRVVGRQFAALFQTWLSFVREKASAHVHCETAEWFWMFERHDEFEAGLRTCLAAFDHIPERTEAGVKLNTRWKHLLGQAHVSTGWKGRLQPLGNLSYCGSAYHYEVPWSEDKDAACGLLSEKVTQEPRSGQRPEDLLHYLEFVHGPVGATRLLRCHCGGQAFRLVYSREGATGAKRTCTRCDATTFVLNSRDYWHDARPVDWACKGCGGAEANVGIGLGLDHAENSVEFVSLGQRCVRCGRLDCCLGWEAFDSLSNMDSDGAYDWANEQFCKGANLADAGRYADALVLLRAARGALPGTRGQPAWVPDLLTSIADASFHLGAWEDCRLAAQEALQVWDGNPYLRLRVGQALFELGQVAQATDWLARLYADEGLSRFKDEDPKYLNLIRGRAAAPPGG